MWVCVLAILNRINLLLWDRDQCAYYSYHLEVSMDQEDLMRVVDHSKHHCRSRHFLAFPERTVKIIKLEGTHNTYNVFLLVTWETWLSAHPVEISSGFVAAR